MAEFSFVPGWSIGRASSAEGPAPVRNSNHLKAFLSMTPRYQTHSTCHGRLRLAVVGPFLALASLSLVVSSKGDTAFTGTGWLAAVPVPGILATNAAGQVSLKGNVHVLRVQSDNTLVAGRLQAGMDLVYLADGSALFTGAAYAEPGTWDSAGASFTPAGGVWDLRYQGVSQADNSNVIRMTGYGIGGPIDGKQVELTATRAAGPVFDPAIPYQVSGTIKPPHLNARVVVDDFADNNFTWPSYSVGPVPAPPTGTFLATESNGQLTIGATWPSPTARLIDSAAWADLEYPWAAAAGQTVEARVDLIALSETAAGAALALWHASDPGQAYYLVVGPNSLVIAKETGVGMAVFRGAQASLKDRRLVLSLALTPVGGNVILTGKALDRDNGAVIAQVAATDTPASDPTLSGSELAELTGGRLWPDISTDPVGPPYTEGSAPLILVYHESDVTPVTASATFDNLELRTYEVPQIGVEPALRLTWPSTGMSFGLEAAPTVNGPWLPVLDGGPLGLQQTIVPADGPMKFFRARQAP